MSNDEFSKVLIQDNNPDYLDKIKSFCDSNELTGLKARADNVMEILESNVDLSAIFISEDFGDIPQWGLRLGKRMHLIRPDIPIFLRRNTALDMSDLDVESQSAFCASYTMDLIDDLKPTLSQYIFSLYYPNKLVRGIQELTEEALNSQFKDINVESSTPFLVRENLIYGEMLSLIPLDSSWCRGYLLVNTDKEALTKMIENNFTGFKPTQNSINEVNGILSEITNLVWGGFRVRYVDDSGEHNSHESVQVPIVIDHTENSISFGSEAPQLCFKYTLFDKNNSKLVEIFQRMIFHLHWMPELFTENKILVDELIDSGELEFF
ncbi:MAG: chemotaxis protein CheX [Gammaproteobacteria bacterium]|nr:chemotaxis protein CheX [Gammaproteobacteria bacterium]